MTQNNCVVLKRIEIDEDTTVEAIEIVSPLRQNRENIIIELSEEDYQVLLLG